MRRKDRAWDRARWPAPVGAVLLPLVIGGVLIVVTRTTEKARTFEDIEIATADSIESIEEAPPEIEPELELADETASVVADVPVECDAPPSVDSLLPLPSLVPTFEPPKTPPLEAVAQIKCPMTMKTLAGAARGAAGRTASIARFGGNAAAEAAVMRALRWLKTQQRADGSWKAKGEGDASAFALLAFLSHGEDFNSREFGATVRAAVRYLAGKHTNAMSVYALAEAAAVVKTPVLKEIAADAIEEHCARRRRGVKANAGGLLQRYCAVMAVASARLSGITTPSLEATRADYLAAFDEMRDGKSADFSRIKGEGAWRYMIAAVCLQYLGEGEDAHTRGLVKRLDAIWPAATLGTSAIACCPVRSNYFSTMMFFNGGCKTWEKWNAGMLAAYAASQKIEKGVYVDPDGISREIGSWRCQDQHIGDQPFWPTCYIAHQLMIYYRYLPTYSQDSWSGTVAPPLPAHLAVEIEIEE